MDKIFIMNLGTTSFKFKLFACDDRAQTVLAQGELECVGSSSSHYELRYADGRERVGDAEIPDHGAAFTHCFSILQADGVLKDLSDLNAVGYKAVHGGNLSGTCLVDEALMAEMERVTPLAPAHNPIYLNAMRDVAKRYPQLTQVARFETSFHGTIPDYRTAYGVPDHWRTQWGIRRYGFHGSSHQYIAETMAKLDPTARRIVNCHLGGSSSICGILDGKSMATSMGATLQSGLFNNNRVGDFEPFCLPMVMEHYDGSLEKVLQVLSKESGLLGLSGVSNDLRPVIQAMEDGNERAKLAVEALADNILGFIGMYSAYLGGLDAVVFTGGIGTGSALVRKMVCQKLGWMGLALDEEANNGFGDGCITAPGSKVRAWRLKTNEELVVARCVYRLLHGE